MLLSSQCSIIKLNQVSQFSSKHNTIGSSQKFDRWLIWYFLYILERNNNFHTIVSTAPKQYIGVCFSATGDELLPTQAQDI
jgi:hypothetical protein